MMKRVLITFVLIIATLSLSCIKKEGEKMNSTNNQFFKDELFSDGQKAPEQVFTGNVWVNMLVTDDDNIYNTQVYNVMFEAGARTNWHSHPGGQILLVTSGTGYYQEKGKPARLLKPGDVVEIPPNINHWHGAAPKSNFIHLGISARTQDGAAEWFSKVTSEEYAEATKQK
jgi:quercetin dioxygenase-like cupin family protein